MKAHHEHKKIHDLINKKISFDRGSLMVLWAKLSTKLKLFFRHDQTKTIIFMGKLYFLNQVHL